MENCGKNYKRYKWVKILIMNWVKILFINYLSIVKWLIYVFLCFKIILYVIFIGYWKCFFILMEDYLYVIVYVCI